MKYKELSAAHRARLFTALQQLDEQQGGWDKVFQLLNQGQRAAEQAEMSELASQFAGGQVVVLESLKKTGQFLGWELELISLGLAAGNVRAIYQRLREHYQLQLRFQQELKAQMQWPVRSVLVVAAMVFVGAWLYGYLTAFEMLWRLASAYALFYLCAFVGRAILPLYSAGRLPQLLVSMVKRFPGVSILARSNQTYHYLQNLNLCIAGGMSLAQSLKQSARRIPDPRQQQLFMEVYRAVERGQKLSEAMASSGILTGVAIGPMDMTGASAADAQLHLTEAVRIAYVEQLLYWAQWLPQLLYASLPLLVVIELLLV